MKKELPGGVRLSENQSRKLAYVGEFKEAPFLSSGALRRFLRLSQKITLWDKKKKFVDGDLKIVLQDRSDTFVRYLKVTIGQDSYFVKESRTTFLGGGASEILTSNELREILEKEGFNYAEVVKFKLGYEDRSGRTYYVATWDERLTKGLDEWLADRSLTRQEREEINRRYRELRDKLSTKYGFTDVSALNMSYDPQTKKIIIFDANR